MSAPLHQRKERQNLEVENHREGYMDHVLSQDRPSDYRRISWRFLECRHPFHFYFPGATVGFVCLCGQYFFRYGATDSYCVSVIAQPYLQYSNPIPRRCKCQPTRGEVTLRALPAKRCGWRQRSRSIRVSDMPVHGKLSSGGIVTTRISPNVFKEDTHNA